MDLLSMLEVTPLSHSTYMTMSITHCLNKIIIADWYCHINISAVLTIFFLIA
jgi:hypothetical protein